MNWDEVLAWLYRYGHINKNWERITISEDGVYCEDTMENTFISVFTRVDGELIVYVGMMHPKMSAGSSTGVYVESHEDVIYFLENNLEDMYDELMRKVVNR